MRIQKVILVVSIWVACIFVLLGCLQIRGRGETIDAKAIEIWRKQEDIFRSALKGHQKSDEFDRACLFFEQTTGLQMHVNYFTLGVQPTAETARDLVRIHSWYKANKYHLYWDEAAQAVKVRANTSRTH